MPDDERLMSVAAPPMNPLDLLYIPLAIATAPLWAGKKRSGWRERFGKIQPLPPPTRPRVLLHAVSVGEVSALRALVPLLASHAEVVVSATTDTGLKRASELFGDHAHVVRYPLDFSWCVRRFLNAVQPHAVSLVELEVWPNFVDECRRRNIPVGIVNGRLSRRSFKGYARIRPFFAKRLRSLAFACVQDLDYAGRFQALGIPSDKCHITGNMKWDALALGESVPDASDLARDLHIDPARPLIVAGSTGPGEEALLHAACPPDAQLLCAPRKPERFDEAARDLPNCFRRSTRSGDPASSRYLLDTIGELRKAYALADVVVVGRSFMGDLFGSDPVEPVALGKATLMGPYVSDFGQAVSILQAAGGLACTDRSGLDSALRDLLANPDKRRDMGEQGQRAIRSMQGASSRHAHMLMTLLPRGHGAPTIDRDATTAVRV